MSRQQSDIANMADVHGPTVTGPERSRLSRDAGEHLAAEAQPHPGYYSILFETPEDRIGDDARAPDFFADLNCDQIVDAITAGRDEYNLKPFFYGCLSRVGAVRYRHEVMEDLERRPVYEHINLFAGKMRDVRNHLAKVRKAFYKEQKQAWFLDAVQLYCETVYFFATGFAGFDLRSRGLLGFRAYLLDYTQSPRFKSLLAAVEQLRNALAKVQYCVLVKAGGFTVRKYDDEPDYSAEVENTFSKFKQAAPRDYRVRFSANPDMNHIEAKILEFVAKLYPEAFGSLDDFFARNADYIDSIIATFDREIHFYIAYREYTEAPRQAGLRFCYPTVSETSRDIHDYDGFDLPLAHKLLNEKAAVVCNDFELNGRERVLVVSGPNQGGKSTFARAFGQIHYLGSIGCPVPGKDAKLLLFDRIFTHFEKEEKVESLRGKLEDDLLRIHDILAAATPRSIVIMNEIFTSTTIQDETFLSEKIMRGIVALGVLCVWVTFVDELTAFGPQTVSMVSTIVPENPALRTFKIVRRPADGLAYAMAIAQKYRLTYEAIRARTGS